MVSQVTKPTVAPDLSGSAALLERAPEVSSGGCGSNCPRCEARMMINYGEPQCLQCGYVDYQYSPPEAAVAKRSIISTATGYALRYVGPFPNLSDRVTNVRLLRFRNRVRYDVNCPFCNTAMTESPLSGERRELREERYKCVDGHRVSLIPDRSGSLGWK